MSRARRVTGVVVLALGLWAALVLATSERGRYGFWRETAGRVPADPACSSPRGAHAALLQGRLDPGDVDRCAPALLGAHAGWAPLLRRLALDMRAPDEVRLVALLALDRAGRSEPGIGRAILMGTRPAPALRQALVAAFDGRPGGEQLGLAARAGAVHGGWIAGALVLDGAGEPGFGDAAARALAARGDRAMPARFVTRLGWAPDAPTLLRWQAEARAGRVGSLPDGEVAPILAAAPWGADGAALVEALTRWRADAAGEVPGPPQPPLAWGDDVLDQLVASPTADTIREEVHATARWVAVGDSGRRAARLVAALAHRLAVPDDGPRAWLAGDPIPAVLDNGGGAPGAVAFLARAVGAEVGLDVRVGATEDGVRLFVGAERAEVDACGRRVPFTGRDADATALPDDAVAALVLAEAGGARLRRGDWAGAADLLAAARGAWPALPQLSNIDAVLRVLRTPDSDRAPPAAPDGSVRVPRSVVLPRRGRRIPERALEDPTASLLARRRSGSADVATDPEAILVAAYWAARSGRPELARVLLPAAAPGGLGDLRVATALLLGEPARPVGPISRWTAGGSPASLTGCPGWDVTWPGGRPASGDRLEGYDERIPPT